MINYPNLSQESVDFNIDSFKKIIPQDSTALDIGAHSGYFSLIFGECVGENGKVIAFEPNPQVFKNLLINRENNPHLNILTYELACTKENKKYTFNYSDPNIYKDGVNGGYFDELSSKDKIKDFHYHQIEVNGVNLDDFLNKNHKSDLDKIKFIKIDAEGYDKEIIKTLSSVISNSHPVIMVEAFRNLSGEEVKDFYNTLNDLDYLIYDASPHNEKDNCVGPLSEEEFSFYLYKIMNGENFLCFHKDDIDKFNLPKTIPGKTAVVVFGRNDGYKEKERFAIHLTTMLETFDEVIYVDWNSPTQSFLYEVLDMIPKTNRLKHFVIPPKYADMMVMGDEKAQVCNSVLSFNLGIRRTDAEWIVLSTTDIIPPSKETLNDFISKSNKNSMFTFSRRDIEYDDVIANQTNLNKYREHLDNTTSPRYFPAKVTPNDNYSIFNCCGDFQLATKNIWCKIQGYEEMMLYACFADTNVQKKAVLCGFDLVPIYNIPLYHMSHKGMENDGSSPSKQHYNNAWEWVETFDGEVSHGQKICSKNAITWGFSNVEIEFEVI
jgi:FkbM family methyltransferase